MADLPVLEWDEGSTDALADIADLGVVGLMAWGHMWQVSWADDRVTGPAASKQEARKLARAYAKTLLRQVLDQLDRAHDPNTGLVVQVPDEVHDG